MIGNGGSYLLSALNRRRALTRLGLGLAAAYCAPAVQRLSESRAATGGPQFAGSGRGTGPESGHVRRSAART